MTIYLTEKQIEKINALAIQRYSPNEKIQTVSSSALNMIVNLPEQFVFGKSLYPTIFDKATILFVQLIKKHVFANANKRTAFFVLVKFLQLNNEQLLALRESLEHHLVDGKKQQKYSNNNLLQLFITAKQVEGCSSKTIRYYQRTIENLFNAIKESVTQLTTDDLRSYLANYQSEKDCSKANLDNIRRILSSFFAWLEQEEYIIKNPIRRIKKIKTEQNVKETYTDEHLEIMRDNCENLRDLAIIDLLASTGMRVGELVQLNRSDIDFENRECVVFGKGKKERPVYFDARTKIHLRNYLNDRKDSHPALFVTLVGKAQRLGIAGVEIRLRKLGDKLGIQKVHPHKFRRTLATKAIDKGMPIEQVQKLLGHSKIDTTLAYAMVNQNNVKHSHQKFIS